jgi:Zn-dependent peptidase ImmA (M78 family)
VNKLHSPRRQRFTLAHELAHYVLHREEQDLFSDKQFFRSNETNWMEAQANKLAANLLMPEHTFRNHIENGVTGLDDLAEIFGASSSAVKIRAESLGYRIE